MGSGTLDAERWEVGTLDLGRWEVGTLILGDGKLGPLILGDGKSDLWRWLPPTGGVTSTGSEAGSGWWDRWQADEAATREAAGVGATGSRNDRTRMRD